MAEDANDRRARTTSCVLASALFATLPAAAQDYPRRQIELVVPFVAGGTTDNIARLIAQRFSESWGQTVIVNNRPGGGSTIGTNAVAKAPPDGHTLLVTTIGFAINAGLQKLPYDPDQGFRPDHRARLAAADAGGACVAAGDEPEGVHRAGEVEAGRTGTTRPPAPAPRRISPPRCSSRWPASNWCTCRTRATPRRMNALLGGHVKIYFALVPAVLQHIKTGALRAIAVTTEQRLPYLPDVPTIAELGFPGYEISSWQGVFAPAGTPKDVVGKINGELVRMLNVPEIRRRISQEGADPVGSTPDAFATRVKNEIDQMDQGDQDIRDTGLELACGRVSRQVARRPKDSDQRHVCDGECRQCRHGRPCPRVLDHQRPGGWREGLYDQARERQAPHQGGIARRTEQRERQRAARDPHDAVTAGIDHDRDGEDRKRREEQG